MEIKRIVNNLDDFDDIEINGELFDLFESLHSLSFEELIYFEDPLNIGNKKCRAVIHQIDRSITFLYDKNIKITNEVISIIKTNVALFKKALSKIDLKYFIFFSYLNSCLKLDVNYLIRKFNYEFNIENMKEKITKFFNCIHVFSKPNILSNEKNLGTHLNNISFKSLKKDDVMNASLISLNVGEDSNIFHHFKVSGPKLITSLITHIKIIDHGFFLDMMYDLDNLIMVLLFCKELSLSEITECYYEYGAINIDLLFVFLKKTLDYAEMGDSHLVFIKDLLFDFLKFDDELFKKILNLFKHKESLNMAIGLLFSQVTQEESELIIDEFNLNFGASDSLINLREKMLINIDSKSENFNKVLKLVYDNWNSYLNSLLDDGEQGSGLLVSDFNSFILEYYNRFYDKKMLIEDMKFNFHQIELINSTWSSNLTNYKNRIHVYYTRLYVLSFAYNDKCIQCSEIFDCYKKFMENRYLIEVLLCDDAKDSLNEFKMNIEVN